MDKYLKLEYIVYKSQDGRYDYGKLNESNCSEIISYCESMEKARLLWKYYYYR